MLLYIMLYIVLAYLMLFAALTNAVCLNNASFFSFFFSLICANAIYFHALSLFISFFFICITHSAFNVFVFPNYIFTSLLFCFLNIFYERAMSSLEK